MPHPAYTRAAEKPQFRAPLFRCSMDLRIDRSMSESRLKVLFAPKKRQNANDTDRRNRLAVYQVLFLLHRQAYQSPCI